MADPRKKLSFDEVRASQLDDWRQVAGVIKAKFATGDFATGLKLVDQIGAAAEEADHHPDLSLTYSQVLVSLSSHDVDGITSRDIALAQRISEFAKDLGVPAEPEGIALVELGLDTHDGQRLGPFYAALLGAEAEDGDVVDASGQAPPIWWQGPADPSDGNTRPELPEQAFEQRWHLDVWVPHDEAEARVKAALDAGGVLVSDDAAPSFWVLEDADGNRSCICTSSGR
ncbi:4a-hydroxytetrahydrobiopterin dehydratase [Yimella sp. cx-573]|nr:4a-hydroxytetrahydrobiopterin dehydratase [Yimella sp. cx-573]